MMKLSVKSFQKSHLFRTEGADMQARISLLLAGMLLMGAGSAVWGHETDPYIAPPGRDMPDLGSHFSRWFYDAIDRGVRAQNAKIRAAVESGNAEQARKLQTDVEIAHAVNREFPFAILMIQNLDSKYTSPAMRLKYPGTLPGYKPAPSMQQVMAFPLNPFRAWGCAVMNLYGVQLGTDKIGHFTDMGMHYYQTYKGYLAKGESEQQAIRRAIAVGTSDPLKGESALLGNWTAGDYSNGDLAVNYLGFVFYRNLTETQMLKGYSRPPMLVRDGQYWKIASHVRPDSDFMQWYISDHLDEALNPGVYTAGGMRNTMRQHLADNITGTLEHRLDRWGNRHSQAWFAAKSEELKTYWGFDYGHGGSGDELITISDVCFAPPKDPGARDAVGRSPLHRAVAFADLAKVEALLDAGADVNDGVRSDEPINSNWGDTPLHIAAQDGREQIVRLLIARGADVNRANDRGNTPLHRAVEYPGVVTALLDAGAKPNAPDAQGRTPLHWAAIGGANSTMTVLLARGADVKAVDLQGQTALHYAAREGNTAAIAALIGAGADPSAADRFGATPLHVAAAARQEAAVLALLEKGANVKLADAFGCTPLHDAARRGSEGIVAAMINAGASPAVADASGTTPLHLAARNGYAAVAMRLLQGGASPSIAAGRRGTPVDEARRAGYTSLASELTTTAQTAAYRSR
jgi:ankyrin repeat protein